ncbi:hypothetical protein V1525DRAFT_424681 [Lipomyces kononenkoae]|uniref:Uncharacterized protein n=1 Tax=Lipomyces kononenkoae TaxID=34357 RepID=A0ACC3T9C8_LIPKO
MPRKSLRETILGDLEYVLEKLLMLRAEHRNSVERILDKRIHLEAIEEECREIFVIADMLREAGQDTVDDFLDDYLSNTQMDLMKSLLKLAVHASQKYYLSDRVTIPRSQEQFWLLMGQIIDYVVGIPGSRPDCVCFKSCMIYRHQEQLLKANGECMNGGSVTDEDDVDDDAKSRAEDLRVGKERRDFLRDKFTVIEQEISA